MGHRRWEDVKRERAARTWNYRVVRHGRGTESEWLGLHEVHYEDGKPVGATAEPVRFVSDVSIEDLVASLERALSDSRERPVLDFEDFESRS